MKISVSPDLAGIVPSSAAADSSVLQLVVPTAITRPPAALVLLIVSAASFDILKVSVCIWCSSILSTFTGLKVPRPTCNVMLTTLTPFSLIFSSSSFVKCNPAVGAAAEPSFWHILSGICSYPEAYV